MGELHLRYSCDRMKREFKVEVNQGEPQVEYKEVTGTNPCGKHKQKQSDVVTRYRPHLDSRCSWWTPKDYNLLMQICGNVPKEYIPSVEKKKDLEKLWKLGPLAGYAVDSLKVTLTDGSSTQILMPSWNYCENSYKEVAKAAGL
jgi:elongation factor G